MEGVEGGEEGRWLWMDGEGERVSLTLSMFHILISSTTVALIRRRNCSSETPTKRKAKAKTKRTWGDAQPTEMDMAALDYSVDKPVLKGDSVTEDTSNTEDLQALVDQSSLGSRNRDGLYEVKDWEFTKGNGIDILADVVKPLDKNSSSSLGTLGSLFARLTGSKVLTEADLKPVLEGMQQHLMKKNVAKEIAEKVCEGVGESLVGKKVGGFESDTSFHSFPVSHADTNHLISCSHDHRRSQGAFDLHHTYPDTQDLNRSLALHTQ